MLAEATASQLAPPAALDSRAHVALAFAEALTLRSKEISDEEFAAVRATFDEGEVVELAAVAGAFNYFNRFNNALQVEVTR
jgi:alkylhydroperoxidase family enzyme